MRTVLVPMVEGSSVGVLVLVVRREREEMKRSSMYIRLLDITIELCEFLSDFKDAENSQSIRLAVSQLMQECHDAVLEHNSRVSEQNRIICKEVHNRNQELVCTMIGSVEEHVQISSVGKMTHYKQHIGGAWHVSVHSKFPTVDVHR